MGLHGLGIWKLLNPFQRRYIGKGVANARKSFGLARLKDVLDANAEAPLCDLKSAVLGTLLQYTNKGLKHDDVTLIALEIF